ncbi:MAG: fructose-1,6-bisphosphatase [Deltaproteobacteria bacterium]|nr:fructose-1,6-bisphosphatase [Candidatus Anaeroferrophillacea bacterium]
MAVKSKHVRRGLWNHLMRTGVEMGLASIIYEVGVASKYVNHAMRTGDLGLAGTSNLYGEEQLALDVLADEIIKDRLDHTGRVSKIVSEEQSEIIIFERSGRRRQYAVCYDPLDGSSLVDVNLAVGTIVSIYPGDDPLQPGKNQVGAMFVVYGPRTTLVYSTGNGVFEFTLNSLGEYTLTRENIFMKEQGNLYSPGGLRSEYLPEHERYVASLEADGYKLRYSGGFVPDINQILLKGSGVFMYPATRKSPCGKLRLPFELNPMAYLVEQAGGGASTGTERILDVVPGDLDQRSPVYIGCRREVALAERILNGGE